MTPVKFILSMLAYAVSSTAFAFIYHEQIFGEQYRAFNIFSAGENISLPLALFGSVIEGAVLTYLVARFAPATGRVRFAIFMGVLVCVFSSSYGVFQTAALENVQGGGRGLFIALEFVAMMCYGLLGGAVVGWVNRKG